MEMAQSLLERRPEEVGWLEIHPENYMRRGGRYPDTLRRAQDHWPIVTHGLTMCFGAVEPFEREYLQTLRGFLHDIGVPWHSDHMCFGGADGAFAHDLLPLPFTDEAADTVVQRLKEARDAVDKPLAMENVSYYAPSGDPTAEADFVVDVLERADALLLLDVNNVYVNAKNHGFDPYAYIDRIPPERVAQMHVAGHFVRDDDIRIDTHGESVCEDVYQLFEHAVRRMGPKPVLLERDNNIPPLGELLTEVRRLREIYDRATAGSEKCSEAAAPFQEATR
jgi:hypothetical protein